MDDVCSNPPFYYTNPFNRAPRLKRCHVSWRIPHPYPHNDPSISFIGCSEWIKLKWGNVESQIKSNTSQTGSRSADQARTIVSIPVFCSIRDFLNVVARIDFAVLSSPTAMRTVSSTKTSGYSKQIYGLSVLISPTNISRCLVKMFQPLLGYICYRCAVLLQQQCAHIVFFLQYYFIVSSTDTKMQYSYVQCC